VPEGHGVRREALGKPARDRARRLADEVR